MRTVFGLLVLSILVAGCGASKPPANLDFASIDRLQVLEGVYQNLGEAGPEYTPTYLSPIIWPKVDMEPSTIESVEVRALGDSALVVRALGADGVKREDTFVRGKDFDLHEGRLLLKRDWDFHATDQAGDPFLGMTHTTIELGIDEAARGKYQEKTFLAGTIFLIVPIVATDDRQARFVRRDSPTSSP